MYDQKLEAVIEMVAGSNQIYAIDKKTGRASLNRTIKSPLPQPFNYGFLTGTRGGDNDELDVFVISAKPLRVGDRLLVRAIGVLHMTDENGIDSKIIAVDLSDRRFNAARSIRQIDPAALEKLKDLVAHNKDGDEGKWVNVFGYADADSAFKSIITAMVH